MSVPLETLIKQLADSGILSPGKLENFVPPKAHPHSAEKLVAELVKQNQLTPFQAQQIKGGRARALMLGAYTILDKIGAGGMGRVFKAEHRRMHRIVAIKMLPAAMTKDQAAIARFEREVTAAAKLRHPNIVAADDAAEANGVHFLVMEYVDGKDLAALVKQQGPLPVGRAVGYILQAARGLEFAHSEGVIHRDIKPANLLLDKKGVVKVLDMGLARLDSPGGNAAAGAELTGTGAVMGTVDYMAPEQALNTKHADQRADIYSLGITLYYLLAGKCAYGGETIMEKLLAHREQPIPALKTVQANAPDRVQAIFDRMIAKKAEDRYQTMSEVVAAIEALRPGESRAAVANADATAGSPVAGQANKPVQTGGTNPRRSSPEPAAAADEALGQSEILGQGMADSEVVPAILDVELSSPRRRGKGSRRRQERPKQRPWKLLAIAGVGVAGCMLLGALLFSRGSTGDKSSQTPSRHAPAIAARQDAAAPLNPGPAASVPLAKISATNRELDATAGEPAQHPAPPANLASKPELTSEPKLDSTPGSPAVHEKLATPATNEQPPAPVSQAPLTKRDPGSSAATSGKPALPGAAPESESAKPESSDPAPPAAKPARFSLPDGAAEKKARELVKEVFGADYAAAKGSPEDLASLAKKMLQQAAESKDAANRYVLLDFAKSASVDAGNLTLAFQALDGINEAFQTESLDDDKMKVVEDIVKKARTAVESTAIMPQLQPALDDLVANDKFEVAKSLSKIAMIVARKTRDAGTVKSATARHKEIDEAAKTYAAEIKPALAVLQQTPNDPAANLIVGRWLCFSKEAWDKGIPMLVLGDDAGLKTLAETEIAGKDKVQAADGWWNLAKKDTKARRQLQAHAADLYRETLAGLSGLEKSKVEQRLVEAESAGVKSQPAKAAKIASATPAASAPKVARRRRGIERQVKVIAAGCDGHVVSVNGERLMIDVKRDGASGATAPLADGDIIAVKIRGRFDVMSLWMVFLTDDDQYLFETSTDWIAYLPPDQQRWWDVQNQKITRQQALYAPASREYVDLVKNSVSRVVSNYRIGQPIYSPLQNTEPIGEESRPGYLPTYVYYVVTKSDLLPKKDARAKK